MLPLNDPGQTKKVLGMLFRSRQHWVECVFTVCASGYALNTSISYCFVFGPGGPSSFSLTNKQTNEQANNAWSQVSFILTPVSSAVTTLNKRSKWRFHVVNPMQAKARIIQYFHPVPYFADCEKALPGQLKTFQESSLLLSTPTQAWRRPVLTLKSLSEGVVGPCTKLLRHFRVFFNFAPGNKFLYFKNGTKSRPPPHPFSKLFSPNSLLVHFVMFHRKQHWNRGGGNCGKHFCQDQCNR